MKKAKILTACYICVVLLLICACGNTKQFSKNVTCEMILNAATDVESHDNTQTYIKNKNELDSFYMSLWSDGLFKECEEFDLIDDYAICYSNDNTTYEISVLKAKTNNDAQQLKSLLERRKQTLSEGDKAEYDPNFNLRMDDAKILVEGDFVILLITPDNTAVLDAIEKLKE
ncbi:MAG: DUF4358 domain-containing protein [Clostridia bacterium]|nr:DUF4358 domain-containing protein [Clostridia bacterium]